MENINNLFNDKLAAIRKTHDEKHAEIVATQQQQIINLVSQALENAHSRVTGLSSSPSHFCVIIYEDEFKTQIQPETRTFLESLGFTIAANCHRPTTAWQKLFQW